MCTYVCVEHTYQWLLHGPELPFCPHIGHQQALKTPHHPNLDQEQETQTDEWLLIFP